MLRRGILIYPTETAYAIGCDATNQKAVDLVFKIKRRPKNKTLPLIASSLAMVKRYCRMSAREERLARKYWPGPLTLILHRRGDSVWSPAKGVVAKDGTIAIRVSSHPVARALARRIGRPIVSTSANISGKGECYSVGAIHELPLPALFLQVIDVGHLPKRKPSTIVKIENGKIKILRQGEIKLL